MTEKTVYKKMMDAWAGSDNKKVYDLLTKAGWKLDASTGQTLVRNMLKKHKGDVAKTAKDIMQNYPQFKTERGMYRDFRKLQFLFDVAHKAGWDSKKDRKQPRDAAINYLESKGFIVTVDNRYFPEGTRYKITRSLGAGTYQPINKISDLTDPNITQAGSSKRPGLLGVDKPVRKKRSKRGLYL